jgi:drug/metabolite transporter (DMT)-like permease
MFRAMPDAVPSSARTGRLPSPLILACLAATWFVWGSTYLAIKFALTGLPPFLMMASRFVVAGGLLLAYTVARGAPWPSAREWRNATIVGTLMLGCGMGGTANAELSIGSGVVVAFIAVTPLLMVVASLPFGVRPAPGEVLGILVGLGGVLMLVQGAGFRASPNGLGWMVLASSGWTLGSVLSQRRFHLARGAAGFASQMLCGGAALLLAAVLAGERLPGAVPMGAAVAWGYLVVFGSLLAFNAYMVLLGRASAGLATSYTYVNPVIALLLGVALGGEQVTPWEWLSAGVVLAGVVLLLFSRR